MSIYVYIYMYVCECMQKLYLTNQDIVSNYLMSFSQKQKTRLCPFPNSTRRRTVYCQN